MISSVKWLKLCLNGKGLSESQKSISWFNSFIFYIIQPRVARWKSAKNDANYPIRYRGWLWSWETLKGHSHLISSSYTRVLYFYWNFNIFFGLWWCGHILCCAVMQHMRVKHILNAEWHKLRGWNMTSGEWFYLIMQTNKLRSLHQS